MKVAHTAQEEEKRKRANIANEKYREKKRKRLANDPVEKERGNGRLPTTEIEGRKDTKILKLEKSRGFILAKCI